MNENSKTITVSFSAYERVIITIASKEGQRPGAALELAAAADLAVGLGGWERDPADPFRSPYAPEEAALTGIERHWTGTDEEEARALRSLVADLVAEKRAEDADAQGIENRTPERSAR